jgi:choline kinase
MPAFAEPHAIILAAGMGTRLAPHTDLCPKVLVPVGTEAILSRILRQLGQCGVRSVTIVTGDRAAQVEDAARAAANGLTLRFLHNPVFATTNNSYSLALASDALERGALLIEGDVVADASVVRALAAAPAPSWIVRPFLPGMDGAVLRPGADGRLAELSIVKRGAAVSDGAFKSMGMLRIDARYGSLLARWLHDEVVSGGGRRYYDLVVADHLAEAAPALVSVDDGFWVEIDTPEDLAIATRWASEAA